LLVEVLELVDGSETLNIETYNIHEISKESKSSDESERGGYR